MSDDPALRPDADIGPSLAAIAHHMLADATQGVDQESDAASIHDIRRALKRWRAFLRLLEPFLGEHGAQLRIEARDMARSLARARDAQAALDALADLGKDYAALSPQSLQTIEGRIEHQRTTAETATLTPLARERLRAALAQTADAVDRWPLQGLAFADIAAGLAEGYRRARNVMPADWTAAHAEELHRLRQRVVAHRYQMEIVQPLWPRLSRVWVGEAQRLRERLGAHQDLAVLTRLLGPQQPLARWRSRLTPVIAARQKDHIEIAMRQAGRLFAEKPRAFQRRLEALWDARVT